MTEKIQNKATKKLNIASKIVNPKISLASKKPNTTASKRLMIEIILKILKKKQLQVLALHRRCIEQ